MGLQHERRRGSPGTRRGGEKIRPFPQSFHGSGPPAWPPSGAQPLPATRPAGIEHLLATLGGHPGPETVAALAHQLARLVGPLHDVFSACRGGAPRAARSGAKPFRFEQNCRIFGLAPLKGRRLYASPAGPVNANRPPRRARAGRSRPLKWQ
jgi:hypothetical protein